jgi:hypothetical protein
MISFKTLALPLSYPNHFMQDPIPKNQIEANAQDASQETRESLEHARKNILDYRPPANSWLPLVIGGSVALVVVGYLIGRQYQADTRTRTEKFIQELQDWIEEHGTSLPSSLRERLSATGSFLGQSLRKTPLERLISQFRSKPRRFWDIFS